MNFIIFVLANILETELSWAWEAHESFCWIFTASLIYYPLLQVYSLKSGLFFNTNHKFHRHIFFISSQFRGEGFIQVSSFTIVLPMQPTQCRNNKRRPLSTMPFTLNTENCPSHFFCRFLLFNFIVNLFKWKFVRVLQKLMARLKKAIFFRFAWWAEEQPRSFVVLSLLPRHNESKLIWYRRVNASNGHIKRI